jgi:hypothetical protein
MAASKVSLPCGITLSFMACPHSKTEKLSSQYQTDVQEIQNLFGYHFSCSQCSLSFLDHSQ